MKDDVAKPDSAQGGMDNGCMSREFFSSRRRRLKGSMPSPDFAFSVNFTAGCLLTVFILNSLSRTA